MITIRLLAIAAIGGLLSGCASEFSMRSLPPEAPAAVNASAVRAAEAMEAAAKQAAAGQKQTSPGQEGGAPQDHDTASPPTKAGPGGQASVTQGSPAQSRDA